MKKKKRTSLEKKLKAYSAAAAGTLLLAPSANAAVQYSGIQNLDFVPGGALVPVDLNGDGAIDFIFGGSTWSSLTTYYAFPSWIDGQAVGLYPTTVGGYGGLSLINSSYGIPANLPTNYAVQNTLPGTNYWTSQTNPYYNLLAGYSNWIYYGTPTSTGTWTLGNFLGSRGYIGVRFRSAACPVGAPPHYGWIQFRSNSTATQGRVIDWAYEDSCGTPILAAAPIVPAPTLNQWGIIVLIALLAGAGTLMLKKRDET